MPEIIELLKKLLLNLLTVSLTNLWARYLSNYIKTRILRRQLLQKKTSRNPCLIIKKSEVKVSKQRESHLTKVVTLKKLINLIKTKLLQFTKFSLISLEVFSRYENIFIRCVTRIIGMKGFL